MFFLTLIGFVLRIFGINKPEGLWNDEYVSWMVASVPFGEGFTEAVLKQCHMPVYYLYLKPFTAYSDIILRLTSVIPSVLGIWVMYFVGKEYSKKTGIYAASVTGVLSFLIYYAQEVRFYSLLFLFSSMSLLFTIRILKNCSKFNLAGYIVSNLLIFFTHVLGGIYLFFNIGYVIYKKKTFKKRLLLFFIPIFLVLLFFGQNIINQIPSSQWWGKFSYTNILFLLSDFLSPVLTNNINAPTVFFYNIRLALWMSIPTILGVFVILAGIKNNKGISAIALGTVCVMSILALCGKIVFITKYATEILPIIIILLTCGFVRMKRTGIVLFCLFLAFHIAYIFNPNYVTKLPRKEGHRIVGEILNKRTPDKVIFTYYAPDRFLRYWNGNAESYYISKSNRFEYKDKPEKILDNINTKEKVSVVFLDSVSFFPEDYINNYTNLPEMFVTFSHIKNMLIKELNNNYKDFTVDKLGEWTVITAVKK